MTKKRVNSPTCDIFTILWFLEVFQNKILSKSFPIFVFAIFRSILIGFEQSWTIFNSQYNWRFPAELRPHTRRRTFLQSKIRRSLQSEVASRREQVSPQSCSVLKSDLLLLISLAVCILSITWGCTTLHCIDKAFTVIPKIKKYNWSQPFFTFIVIHSFFRL